MPNTKIISLSSAVSASSVLRYIYDPDRESHQEYMIERDNGGPHDEFVAAIEESVLRLNQELEPSNQVSIRAHWLIIRFPDGSELSAPERTYVQRSLADGLGSDGRWAWHVNRLNLSSDFNMVVPAVKSGLLPRLRRWLSRSLWATTKALMDRTVLALNAERHTAGRPPIPEIGKNQQAAMRMEDGRSLIEALATAAAEMKIPVSAATLPTLLSAIGFKEEDWSIEDDDVFIIRGRKRRLKLDAVIYSATALSNSKGPVLHVDRSKDAPPAAGGTVEIE